MILKSIIETGFADNCIEELLEFDENGVLIKTTPGIPADRRLNDNNAVSEVFRYKDGSSVALSGNQSMYDEDLQSVVQNQLSVAPSSI